MLVRDVMSTHLETISPSATVQECAKKMQQSGVGVLPVWQDGQPVGMVTDRDVCCRTIGAGKDPARTPVQAIMSGVMVSCLEDQDCKDAARLMKEKSVRRLMVVDRKRAIVGMLSVDDLARCSHDLAGEVLEVVAPWPH